MNEMDKFELTNEDEYAIEIAKSMARRFLTRNISPQQVIGLGNALYALERLPQATPWALCEFGIIYRAGTKQFRETRYIDFKITETLFEISVGGSVYDEAVGSDRFSEPGWVIDVNGYRRTVCDLYTLQDTIKEYLNLGAEITVTDESDIDYE